MTLQADEHSWLEASPGLEACRPAEFLTMVGTQPVIGLFDGALSFGERVVDAHRGPLVALQRFGDQVLTASRDGFAALWDGTGRPLAAHHNATGPLCCATLTEATVVLGDDEGCVFAWDLHTGQSDWIGDVRIPLTALAGQGSIVFMGTADGCVHSEGLSEKRHRGAVIGLYAVGGPEPLSVGADGRVRLGSDLLLRVNGSVSHSALFGNTLVLVVGREIQQWDLRRLALVRRTVASAGEIVDVEVSALGVWVLLDGDSRPRLWT